MFLTKKASNWNNIGYVKSSWRSLGGIVPERLVILDAVWKKEIGAMGKHCELIGINKGYLVIKTNSSAAYNEILLRGVPLLRSLNKYFAKPWLKGFKMAAGM